MLLTEELVPYIRILNKEAFDKVFNKLYELESNVMRKREKCKQYQKKYRKENREKFRISHRVSQKKYYHKLKAARAQE